MKGGAGILGVLLLVWEGLRAPRPVAAEVMSRRPGVPGALLLVTFSYLVGAIVIAAVPGFRPPLDVGDLIGLHLQGLGLHFLLFAVTSGIATWLGRLVGGSGDFPRVAAAVGWAFVLQSTLMPFAALAASMVSPEGVPQGALLLVCAILAVYIWQISACIAEAHGFRSTVAVAGVVIGLSIPLGMIAIMFLLMTAIGGP